MKEYFSKNKNKLIILLAGIFILCAVIPSFSFAEAIPTMKLETPSDYYKNGETFTVTVRIANADMRTVGFCIRYDKDVVQLSGGSAFYDSAEVPHELIKGQGVFTPLDYGASNTNGYIKGVWAVDPMAEELVLSVGEEASLKKGSDAQDDTQNTLLTTGEGGLVVAKINFTAIKDGDSGISFGVLDGDMEFSSYGSFIYDADGGYDAVIPSNYTTEEKPEKTPSKDAASLKAVFDSMNEDGVINNDDSEALASLREALSKVNGSALAKELSSGYLAKAQDISDNFDRMAASHVVELINGIGEVDLNDKEAIDNAYIAYDSLSESQKEAVKAEYDTLKSARAEYDSMVDAVDEADKAINSVSGINTAQDIQDKGYSVSAELIGAARNAYDNLKTPAQRAEVNVNELQQAEEAMKEYESSLENASAVDILIEKIGTVSIESGKAILAAEEAYDSLSGFEKEIVVNHDILTAARKQYDILASKKASADVLTEKVHALDEVININSDEEAKEYAAQIEEVKAEMARLKNEDSQAYAYIDEEKLENIIANAEDKLYNWQTRSDADSVNDSIEALPDVDRLTVADAGAVMAVRNAYEALDEDARGKIDKDNLEKLNSAVERTEKLLSDKNKADGFVSAVDSLGAVVYSDTYHASLTDALNIYNALADEEVYSYSAVIQSKAILDEKTEAYDALHAEVEAVCEAINKVAEINAQEDISDEAKTLIASASEKYDRLSSAQKKAVYNYTQLEEARAALDEYEKAAKDAGSIMKEISAVALTEKYSLQWVNAAEKAISAYDGADNFTRSLVTNADELSVIKTEYEGYKSNIDAANVVISAIDGIGNIEYITSADMLLSVRSSYEALTDGQKVLVSNYSVLCTAEETYAVLEGRVNSAKDAVALISHIDRPQDVPGNKELIKAANTAYGFLNQDTQKSAVDYSELESANKALAEYEAALLRAEEIDSLIMSVDASERKTQPWADAFGKAERALDEVRGTYTMSLVKNARKLEAHRTDYNDYITDINAAVNVQTKIIAIGVVKYTPDSKSLIDAARDAYDSLTVSQKSMVTNVNSLFRAENVFDNLHTQLADVTAKMHALKDIDDITDITTDNMILISDAFSAYENLSEEMKSETEAVLVEYLTKAKTALDSYNKSLSDVKSVKDTIDAIGEVTLSSEEAILLAEGKVLSLDEFASDLLGEVYKQKLSSLRAKFDKLTRDNAAAVNVMDRINSLGSAVYTDEYKELLANAQSAMNSLTDEQKALVTQTGADKTLSDRQVAYDILHEQTKDAHALIETLPHKDDIILVHEADIISVRNKINRLTREQKNALSNIGKLTVAENRISDLKAASGVEEKIDALSDEALFVCEEEICSVKESYDLLTAEQKTLVKNADKLISLTDRLAANKETVNRYFTENKNSLQIKDETGCLSLVASHSDIFTDRDKDDIISGKSVVYTIIGRLKDNGKYTQKQYEAFVAKFELAYGEEASEDIFEVIVTKTVTDAQNNISSEVVKLIPGSINAEFTAPQRMHTTDGNVIREFSAFTIYADTDDISKEYISRVTDTDETADIVAFTADGPFTFLPVYTDTVNPVTGDALLIYVGAFVLLMISVLFIGGRRRTSA